MRSVRPTFSTTTGFPCAAAIECGDKLIWGSDGLNKPADHFGVRIVDQVLEIIGRDHHGFVPGRDDMAEAKAPDVGQQADAERAALGDDADIAGEAGRVAQLLQIGRAAIMRAEHSHAIGPAEREAGVAADPFDFGL